MRHRCRDKKDHRYGGRGIAVCDEWQDYETFRAWADANGWQQKLEIDRIDNDGPYSPGNCRIVTHQENCQNRPPPTWLRKYVHGVLR